MTGPADQRYTFNLRQLMAAVTSAAILSAGLAWAHKANAWWWAGNALDCSIYFYPRLTWVACGAAVAALIVAAIDRRVRSIRSLWLLLTFAVPLLLLCFGIVFRQDCATALAAEARTEVLMLVVDVFPWAIIPVAIALLVSFRSVWRWVIIVGISTAALWLSLGARLMSAMSITDDWL